MKKISSEELKQIQLNVLCQFRNICEKEGFRYSLIGGSLIGAVRHQGFIPWDDDIDVGMPRPDYERFISYCRNHLDKKDDSDASYYIPFGIVSHELDKRYKDLSAKIFDKRTICVERFANRWNCEYGAYVDVFAIDAIADTYEEALKRMNKIRLYRELLIAAQWKRYEKSISDKKKSWFYELARFGCYILSRFIDADKNVIKTEKYFMNNDFEKTAFVALVNSPYRNKEIIPASVYKSYRTVVFEGEIFKAVEDYDTYLKAVFGDYMKLLPIEKRVTHHSFDAYWK